MPVLSHKQARIDLVHSVSGRPNEQQWFTSTHRVFLERLPNLNTAVNLTFARDIGSSRSLVDKVVFALGYIAAVEDFSELLLLCSNGYGLGGMKILRGLYERAVTASYLHHHPDKAQQFVDYGWVSQRKRNLKVKEAFGQQFLDKNPGLQSQFEFVETQFNAVKHQFLQGTKKPRVRGSWADLDFVTLAERTGDLGQPIFVLAAYLEPTQQAHSTTESILARLQEREGRVIVGRRKEQERQAVTRVLLAAHGIMLQIVKLQYEHFELKAFEQTFSRCDKDFQDIWMMNAR